MRIIRTFHPVGQGAFYSESFYDVDGFRYNVVYDCGVNDLDDRRKKIVRNSFSKEDTIDFFVYFSLG